MPRNKDQVAILHAGRRPGKVMIEVSRLVVFVNSKESDVEVIARIGEVIRVAAEEGDIEFRRKHQPHIRVLFVLVQVVHLTRIEDHHIAA